MGNSVIDWYGIPIIQEEVQGETDGSHDQSNSLEHRLLLPRKKSVKLGHLANLIDFIKNQNVEQ